MFTGQCVAYTVLALLALAGCSKKEDPQPAVETPETTAAQPAPVLQQPMTFAGPPQPQQWMTDAQAQQQAGDYDKAAQYLLQIQRHEQVLSQEQAAAYWKQMTSFQADLASRVAAGDPSARAASERLRASTMH